MTTLIRWALLLVIGILLVGVVVRGLGTTDTGIVEKVALVAVGVGLVVAASFTHRIGRKRTP